MSPNDVILTGPPRSGTTLSCELLNAADDTVALDEPIQTEGWPEVRTVAARLRRRLLGARPQPPTHDVDAFCDMTARFFDDVRADVLSGRGAVSKTVGGQVTGAKFADRRDASGHREHLAQLSAMPVDKPLADDFTLVVKHVAAFTAALPELVKRWRCYAIVRNPLSTMASWQTIGMPINEGRVPMGERFDAGLKATLDSIASNVDRQFVVLHWFFDRFASCLPRSAVVRYEDIVETNGRALAAIAPAAAGLDRPLASRNRADVYDTAKMRELGERLLAEDGAWWRYYTTDEVRELMEDA